MVFDFQGLGGHGLGDRSMTEKKSKGQVIYFNEDDGFGYAVIVNQCDKQPHIIYFDLEAFPNVPNRRIDEGGHIKCIVREVDDPCETRHLRKRYVADNSLCITIKSEEDCRYGLHKFDGSCASVECLKREIEDHVGILIIHGMDVGREGLDLTGININKNCLPIFIDSKFNGPFVMADTQISRSIYFLRCKFFSRFSMRAACVKEDVHFAECSFSGKGGVSFKKLQCENLYLDRGIIGPDDEVWLDQAKISGILSMSGTYGGNVFMQGGLDDDRLSIGSIYIGKQYSNTIAKTTTRVSGDIFISNSTIDRCFEFSTSTVRKISFDDVEIHFLKIHDCHIDGRAIFNKVSVSIKRDDDNKNAGMYIENNRFNDQLQITDCSIYGGLSLRDNIVSSRVGIRNCSFPEKRGIMDVYGLMAAHVTISPSSVLFAGKKANFSNPKFWLLKRQCEHKWALMDRGTEAKEEKGKLAEEYLSFKKWFSDAGDLYMEDAAYYNMRHYGETSLIKYIFLNYLFGWGVRLWNVLFTATTIVGVYAVVYILCSDMGVKKAVLFSVESFFFGAILSDWAVVIKGVENPLSHIAVISMSEGAVGILLVTLLVGAYMRKLLR